MLVLVLAAALAAGPRAPPRAGTAIYVPRLDKLTGVTEFLSRAGKHAPLLEPTGWRAELHPILWVDLTDPAALTAVGVAPKASATYSELGRARFICLEAKDPALHGKKLDEKLSTLGKLERSSGPGGTKLVAATQLQKAVAGYAFRDGVFCAVYGGGAFIEELLADAASLVQKPSTGASWKKVATLPGALFVHSRHGLAGADGSTNKLVLRATSASVPLPKLLGAGPSPYAAMTPSGLMFARLRASPEGVEAMLASLRLQLSAICPTCERSALSSITSALAPLLSGNAVVRVDSVRVQGPLSAAPFRFFALRHAYLAELKTLDSAKKALDALGKLPNVERSGDGYTLKLAAGEVRLGISGGHLYFGNDPAAVAKLLETLPSGAAKMAHGAEYYVNPKLAASGLAQVSLLDVMGSAELAGLFAVGTELGALLEKSEAISGWLDSGPDGGHLGELVWSLPPKP